jgi:hypothetical protein
VRGTARPLKGNGSCEGHVSSEGKCSFGNQLICKPAVESWHVAEFKMQIVLGIRIGWYMHGAVVFIPYSIEVWNVRVLSHAGVG